MVPSDAVAVATFKGSSESLDDFLPQLPPFCGRVFFSSVVASGTMLPCRPVGSSGAVRRNRAVRAAGPSSKAPNHALQRTPAWAQGAHSVQPGAAELGFVRRLR